MKWGILRVNKEASLARPSNKLSPASCALAMIEEHARWKHVDATSKSKDQAIETQVWETRYMR